MPTFPMPGVTQTTSSGPVAGGLGAAGLTTAIIGAFPFGPAFDPLNPSACLVYTGQNGASRFGSELLYNDLGGYGGPPSLAAYLGQAAPGRNAPVALVIRTGLTQASFGVATASTITAVPTLGGADGNGTTFAIAAPVDGTQAITITPPAGNVEGLTADAPYSVATGATWAAVAAAINGQSKNVTLTIATADQATAIPSTLTTYTLASGTTGAAPTSSQINAGIDLLGNVAYLDLPINGVMPLFSDTATSGVTLHALGAAVANIGNGQRMRVFGSVDLSLGQGSAAVAAIVTLATTLQPSENGGDSGRCMLIANNAPTRVDPAGVGGFSTVPRRYAPYVFAAAVAGLDAALTPQKTPRARRTVVGGWKLQEGYTAADRTTLLQGGANVAFSNAQLVDERTTAKNSGGTQTWRALAAVQACEDIMEADLANDYNTAVIETATISEAQQNVQTRTDAKMRLYAQLGLCAVATAVVSPNEQDPTQLLSAVNWTPDLGIRGVALSFNLSVPLPGTTATS